MVLPCSVSATAPPTIAHVVSRSPSADTVLHSASTKSRGWRAMHQIASGTVSCAVTSEPLPRTSTALFTAAVLAMSRAASIPRRVSPCGVCASTAAKISAGATWPDAQHAAANRLRNALRLAEEPLAERVAERQAFQSELRPRDACTVVRR